MSDRGLKPLFVVDAMATGALLGAMVAAALKLGGPGGLPQLYGLGFGGIGGALIAGSAAALLVGRLQEAQLRLGIRVMVGVFLATWGVAWWMGRA